MTVAELIQRLERVAQQDCTLEVYTFLNRPGQFGVSEVEVERHHSDPDGPYIVVLS